MSLTTSHNPPAPAHWPLPSDVWPLEPEGSTDTLVCANPPSAPLNLNSKLNLPPPAVLLEGFRLLLQFLVEQEADYLYGARLHARSPQRTNYRLGYYRRKQRTPIGRFPLRVPHLLYFVPRVPIAKRATRLAPEILESLARIYALRAPAPRPPATPLPRGEGAGVRVLEEHAAALIKTLWTLELPDTLLAALAEKLTPILEQWRSASSTVFQPVDGSAAQTAASSAQ